jgi:hypothetical protein
MSRKKLQDWLGTDASKAVGQQDGRGEPVGRRVTHEVLAET